MKQIVGVADCKVSTGPEDVLITHALGSCLGIVAYDDRACVGGMLHVMMPLSEINPEKAKLNPYMFVDTGFLCLLDEMEQQGASRKRMRIIVAGGASVHSSTGDRFAIGKRNIVVFKRMMWSDGLLVTAEDVGGQRARTMRLYMESGRVVVSSGSEEWELGRPGGRSQRGSARNVA